MANNIIKGRNINYYSLFIPTNNDDGGGEGTAVVRKSLLSRVRVEVQFACRVKAHFACRGVEITTDEVVHARGLEHANARRSVLQAARTPKMNYNRPRLFPYLVQKVDYEFKRGFCAPPNFTLKIEFLRSLEVLR